jgi:UDP-N-acetylmuramoyl-tripeptide--D-alanyl-D-alanine ligase
MRSEVTVPTVPFRTVRFPASQLATAIGAELVGGDVPIDGAHFDSRELLAGQLFVPLVAARDGHDFIAAAVERGAPAYLTAEGPVAGVEATAISVPDTAIALIDAARWARGRLPDRVIGITGSVGKTSVKDLAAAAIGSTLTVAANTRSFNNEQGLPITILNAADETEVLITEMGMRGFGEIARLCEVARPTVGLVTTVGASHTERVGGIDGVARAKRELVEALPDDGTAVLNADDPRVSAMAEATGAGVVTFGVAPAADVRIAGLHVDELARARFSIVTPWGESAVALRVSGAHMATNAAAALAAAGVVGVPLTDAVAGVELAEISPARMAVSRLESGAIVINDAYNANPTSMRAALEALSAMGAERRVAVLGAMAELADPAAAHDEIARLAAELGVEVIAYGTDSYGPARVADPIAALGGIGAGDVVLFKASNAVRLFEWAERLVADRGDRR